MFSALNRPGNEPGQSLQDVDVVLPKSGRFRRKNFQNSDDLIATLYRSSDNGANAQCAATPTVNARVVFGVIAGYGLAGANTLAGKSRASFKTSANLRRVGASTGPANHL